MSLLFGFDHLDVDLLNQSVGSEYLGGSWCVLQDPGVVKTLEIRLQPLGKARGGGSASREYDAGIQGSPEVDIGALDDIKDHATEAHYVLADQARIEDDLRGLESLTRYLQHTAIAHLE